MTPVLSTKSTVDSFESLSFNTGLLKLALLPKLGGKINSLIDLRSGREWLWRHPRLEYKQVPHGSSYVDYADTGGWDECFPSVAECIYPSAPWQDAAIQDHGELWSQSPEFEISESANQVALCTTWQGITLPYTFTRTITLIANSATIHVDYEAMNKADESINYVWCIHPLLAIEPDMELSLPPHAHFNVAGSSPLDLFSSKQKMKYPFSISGLNFPKLPKLSSATSLKVWSDPLPLSEGWAALRANDGELRMNWDASLLPQVAVWMNFGAWAADGGTPYFNLGLEPCIGAQDSLADAVNQYNVFATIPPHSVKKWWLEIELTL